MSKGHLGGAAPGLGAAYLPLFRRYFARDPHATSTTSRRHARLQADWGPAGLQFLLGSRRHVFVCSPWELA